jgi:hypothetical protein
MRIRRGVASRHLPCGCVAGVYETYRAEIVTIIDVRHTACTDPAHSIGHSLPTSSHSETVVAREAPDRFPHSREDLTKSK